MVRWRDCGIMGLCDGVIDRSCLDSPELSLKHMFVELSLAFNNELIILPIPDAAYDLENIHLLDPNDCERISIDRDRKLIFFTVLIEQHIY